MIGTSTERWTTLALTNIYERWRTDSGVNVATTNVWTGGKNGLILSQATAGLRPTLAAAQLNGFGAVAWDGADDVLNLASFVHAQPLGYLMVFKITAQSPGSNHDTVIETGTVGTELSQSCDTTPRSNFNAGGSVLFSGNLTAVAGYSAMVCYANGANSFIMENGATRLCGNSGAGGTTRINLGNTAAGTHPTTISVVEFTPFGALVAGELDKIWNYCRRTYANGVGR